MLQWCPCYMEVTMAPRLSVERIARFVDSMVKDIKELLNYCLKYSLVFTIISFVFSYVSVEVAYEALSTLRMIG